MRVAFVVWDLGRSGGTDTVRGHVERLRARGVEAELVGTGPAARQAPPPQGAEWDVVLGTWWETLPAALALPARAHGVLLQGWEEDFYEPEEVFPRTAAGAVLDLPVGFVCVSDWLERTVRVHRPDAWVRRARAPVDPELFSPLPLPGGAGPLRVLVEGQPSVAPKRIADALAAVRAMREPARVTLACLDDAGTAGLAADEVVTGTPREEMPSLYARHHLLLKLSATEGLGLPALEALRVGRPVVVTPYGGHEDYLRDGENGLLVAHHDPPAAARALDRLAADRGELERLAAAARATAWPGPEEATDELLSALEELAAAPPPAEPSAARLLARIGELRELGRELERRTWERDDRAADAARLRELLRAVHASRAHRALLRAGIGKRAD